MKPKNKDYQVKNNDKFALFSRLSATTAVFFSLSISADVASRINEAPNTFAQLSLVWQSNLDPYYYTVAKRGIWHQEIPNIFRFSLMNSCVESCVFTGLPWDPLPTRRRLLMKFANSIMLYGSEFWTETLEIKKRVNSLVSAQRTAALSIASAYRTVSAPAVPVIAGSISCGHNRTL